ncbi:MAG: hypothetical protein AB1656_08430 [Candidatus Omnitrophota bacterium]
MENFIVTAGVRRRRPRKIGWLIVFSFSLFFLMGCVYLRLLTFKDQLSEFDRHFAVEVQYGFILRFLDPMLYSRDIHYLAKLDASRIEPLGKGERWSYVFAKMQPEGNSNGSENLVFEMDFNAKTKMTAVAFSPVFLQIVPADFLKYSLRSLGSARVDAKNHKVYGDSAAFKGANLHPPMREAVLKGLGAPESMEVKDKAVVMKYRYKLLDAPATESGKEQGIASVTLQFVAETDELEKVYANFAGMKLSINYEGLLKKSKEFAAK